METPTTLPKGITCDTSSMPNEQHAEWLIEVADSLFRQLADDRRLNVKAWETDICMKELIAEAIEKGREVPKEKMALADYHCTIKHSAGTAEHLYCASFVHKEGDGYLDVMKA